MVAAGDQRGERDQRAAAPVEAGAGPDGAPGVLGDQLLEVPGELGRVRGRAVDVLGSEHLAAHLHAVVVLGHATSSRASSRMIVATSSGRSAGAWCADVLEDDEPAVLHAVGDLAQRARAGRPGRRRRPPPPPGSAISREPVADVERRERPAHRDVPVVGGVPQRVQQRRGALRLALEEARREPALRGRRHQRRGAGRTDLCHAVAPHGVVADLRAGAAEHRARAPGRVRRAAAAARPDRRPSRRRRGTGRRRGRGPGRRGRRW